MIKYNERGITLVAIVITVIVLLLLAGVTISVLTGGEDLFIKTKEATDKYNNAAKNEAEMFNKITGDLDKALEPDPNGEFSALKGVNTPDTSKLPVSTTKYVTWTGTDTFTEILSDKKIANWYDYNNCKWANIKTTSTDGSLEAYWVWIPRFAYKLPESSTAIPIEVAFVKGNGTTVINHEAEEEGYYVNDSRITNGETGLYKDATAFAKGTTGDRAWIIHPAFTFGDKQLSGIWVAKYEASNINDSNRVSIRPDVTSWRSITAANMFSYCLDIKKNGGALGTDDFNSVDTHLTKSLEWGAIAILSQSKYGRNGVEITINNSSGYFTGRAGKSVSASSNTNGDYRYNTTEGVLASTTGNIYGIYDISGGTYEYLAGVISGKETTLGTEIDSKYYDLYYNSSNSSTNHSGGKIGDVTAELLPSGNKTWNSDYAYFPTSSSPLMLRGGGCNNTTTAGPYNYNNGSTGVAQYFTSFRPVWISI